MITIVSPSMNRELSQDGFGDTILELMTKVERDFSTFHALQNHLPRTLVPYFIHSLHHRLVSIYSRGRGDGWHVKYMQKCFMSEEGAIFKHFELR